MHRCWYNLDVNSIIDRLGAVGGPRPGAAGRQEHYRGKRFFLETHHKAIIFAMHYPIIAAGIWVFSLVCQIKCLNWDEIIFESFFSNIANLIRE